MSYRNPPDTSIAFGAAVELDGGAVLVELRGLLSSANQDAVRARLAGLLVAHRRVLLDLDRLQIGHLSTLSVFVAAADDAGGWPDARLAVITADRLLRDALHASGASELVTVCDDADLALVRESLRPRQLRARWTSRSSIRTPSRLRAQIRYRCGQWGLSEDAIHTALVVVNELIGNAVVHARTTIGVQVQYDGAALRLRVHDRCLDPPQLRATDPLAPQGRGLQMVDALATRWGWAVDDGGKTVWAVLRCADRPGLGDPNTGIP